MIEASEALFLWTETPMHAGSGATTGAVDLPIQRDRQTGHPMLQAGGAKGVLREHCAENWHDALRDVCGTAWMDTGMTDAVFGTGMDANAFGGALSVCDARLLVFPVRSLRGVCAWITCPYALALLHRDLDRCELTQGFPAAPDVVLEQGATWVSEASPVALPHDGPPQEIVLEEYALQATAHPYVIQVADWLVRVALPQTAPYKFWHRKLRNEGRSHLVVLSDEDFTALVESATNVAQRITIDDETGTVSDTGLWTEECLPSDSLLWNILHAAPPRSGDKTPNVLKVENVPSAPHVLAAINAVLDTRSLFQIGGDETTGRGLVRVRRYGGTELPKQATDGAAH